MNEPTEPKRNRPKINGDDWKYAEDWKRYIWDTNPKLPAKIRRPTLMAFCLAMIQNSTAGLDCYTSDVVLAKMMGIQRKYLKDYRAVAMALEWFVPNGIERNRVPHVRINIPYLQVDVPVMPGSEPRASVANKPKGLHVGTFRREPVNLEDDPWHRERVALEEPSAASTEPATATDDVWS